MEPTSNAAYAGYPQNPRDIGDDESNFDIMDWVFKLLRHWYLFVISLSIAVSIAWLANRTWKPMYQVNAKIILGAGQPANGTQMVMQGFNLNSAYKNIDNQTIILTSRDLVERAVSKINANIDYYTQGRFKSSNQYGYAPIQVITNKVSGNAYGLEFRFHDIDGVSFEIRHEKDNIMGDVTVTGRYGELLSNSLFTVLVKQTDNFRPHAEINFAFLTDDYLVDYFISRIQPSMQTTNSTVLNISMVGNVYQRDVDFLNALCDEFLVDNLQRKNEEASRTIAFIDKQLGEISDSLRYSEGQLQSFRKANQILDLNVYSSTILGHLTSYDEKRLQYNLKDAYLRYLSDYIKRNVDKDQIMTPSSLGVVDPILIDLLNQYNTTLIKLSQTTRQNPYFDRYSEDLSRIRASLTEALRNVKAAFEIEKRDIETQTEKATNAMKTLPDLESQMTKFERQFKMNDTYYTYLLQKRAEAQIQRASNVPDNTILERAHLISITNGGDKTKGMSMAVLVGLLIPFLLVVLKEYLKIKIVDKHDIEKLTSFPYIGSLPHVESKTALTIIKHPKSSIAEAYRMIRTRVNFIAQHNEATCVLVTSTESGDGKTHFSLNYASICAMTGESTILVGLDLRKPSIAERLMMERAEGVTNCLLDQIPLDKAIIRKSEKVNFDILMSGTIPPNPGELIRSKKMLDLIHELKSRYRYVIIDTSPVGIVSDAYPLTGVVDSIIYIVRSRKTDKKFFRTVITQLQLDGIQQIGVVLNDIDVTRPGYGYNAGYRKYGYGYYGKNSKDMDYTKDYYEED
jgi:capsular exopolysaccharide synthesis family protein